MTEVTTIKIYRADHKGIIQIRGKLMVAQGREVDIADVIHYLVEKELREDAKKNV